MFASSTFRKPIERLNRAAALVDGVLLDASAAASACGFMAPVAFTAHLAALVDEAPTPRERAARLAVVLRALWATARNSDEAVVSIPADLIGAVGRIVAEVDIDGPDGPTITVSWPVA